MSFFSSFDTPVVILRPFNTYGPRQSARAVIPTIITQLANGSAEVKLGSINPTRDFNYVTDIVAGFSAALKADNVVGEVINIGSNFEVSIGDVASTIAEIMGVNVDIVEDAERLRPEKSEVYRLNASNLKALELLNWVPRYAGIGGFRQGISQTIDWYSDSNNLKRYKSTVYNL
jgi:dTDP-glucose 4,6-dehydratase